jgi:hypothetical protein
MDKNILIRIVSSIPIVGTALALWLEHTEMGMAQYGSFVGLLRGLVIGMVIAVGLLGASEAVIAGFEIGRFWVTVHFTSHYLYAIGDKASRDAAEEMNRPYYERHPDERPPDEHPPMKKEPSWFESSVIAIGRRIWRSCPTDLPAQACMWKEWTGFEKSYYVMGIHDAVSRDPDRWNQLFVSESNFGGIVDNLNAFYAHGAHADIPVIDAQREVRGR